MGELLAGLKGGHDTGKPKALWKKSGTESSGAEARLSASVLRGS
jgi:hypothetical protein